MKESKWFLLGTLFLSYFISPYLPVEWGWENGILEWFQVVILGVGLILNYTWWQKSKSVITLSKARFLGLGIPLWLIMIGRELSWGGVFYPLMVPAGSEPSFLPLDKLPYGGIVNPLLAVIIVVWFYVFIKYALYKIPYELLQKHRFPVAELAVVILAFIIVDFAEHTLHFPEMEEFDECFAYLGLILFAYQIKTALTKENENVIGESKNTRRTII